MHTVLCIVIVLSEIERDVIERYIVNIKKVCALQHMNRN